MFYVLDHYIPIHTFKRRSFEPNVSSHDEKGSCRYMYNILAFCVTYSSAVHIELLFSHHHRIGFPYHLHEVVLYKIIFYSVVL